MTGINKIILIVDVDRALLRTDLGAELFWAALGRDFHASLRALAGNQAQRQCALAKIAQPALETLPICTPVLEAVQAWPGEIILFSAADQQLVAGLTRALNLQATALGVEPATRPDRASVEQAVLELCTGEAFELIPGPATGPALQDAAQTVTPRACAWSWAHLVKEMRPHQWVKNLLLLLPLIVAQELFSLAVLPVLLAMAAYAMGASAIYVVNDLLDLRADRLHPAKRFRPLAAGNLPIRIATRSSACLAGAAILTALAVSPLVAALVALYMLISLVYSLHLKSLRWVDLGTLVVLYGLRLATGAVAAGVALSPWLWGFAAAVFLALAVVKRLTALARATHRGRLPGRGYDAHHMGALYHLGLTGGGLAVLCFLVYAHGDTVATQYAHPWALRCVSLAMLVWLVRMLRLSRTGQEDFDPIVFVARDRLGLGIIALGVALYGIAL